MPNTVTSMFVCVCCCYCRSCSCCYYTIFLSTYDGDCMCADLPVFCVIFSAVFRWMLNDEGSTMVDDTMVVLIRLPESAFGG